MSCEEESSALENGSKSSKLKYELPPHLHDKLQDIPEAMDFVRMLQKQIKKQKKRLKKLQAKFKHKLSSFIECSTQTEDASSIVVIEKGPKSLADEIKEAAELATQNSGFVYDEVSGLYYDSNTGYYYNAEYGLYYDSTSGTYMQYCQETNTYKFHSQVRVAASDDQRTRHKYKHKKLLADKPKVNTYSDMEQLTRNLDNLSINSQRTNVLDIARQWPPCMRIIVEQSGSPRIKVGSLHILTFAGGTLGREGDHSILLPDLNISKSHLKFTFDKETSQYLAIDLGSRNGTVLNGKRMSSAKQESEAMEVAHGSRIQIGSIVLLCHVHDGSKTCGLCEPGLVQVAKTTEKPAQKTSKSQQHQIELRNLRKKFGVNAYEESQVKLATGYTDRAQKRRQTVGSQNPHEKTEVASLEESISSTNKGFKMLAKMGWKEGQSLGKDNQGMAEPVPLVSNTGTAGIGSDEMPMLPESSVIDKNKQIIWKKTQERFKKLPAKSSVFEEESD